MSKYKIAIFMVLIVTLCLYSLNSINVMAKEKPLEQTYDCNVLSGGQYVQCCQAFTQEDGSVKMWCTLCENTKPPSNCTERFHTQQGEDIASPPTDGVSDDPQAGDDGNPGIPPTEGITDENENENSPSENEDSSTSSTIPSNGINELDASDINGK